MKNKKNIKLKKMFTISIGCFFVLLSLLFFFPCLKLFYYSYHSQQWHKVKCDILFCKVMTEYESSGKGGMAKSYSLDLNYKYIYNIGNILNIQLYVKNITIFSKVHLCCK